MGKRISPDKSRSREKNWDKIFNALMKLSQNLQKDRQLLVEKVEYLNDFIYENQLLKSCESLKAELLLSLKEKEAAVYKHRYENTKDLLADHNKWFDYHSQKCSLPTNVSDDVSNEGQGTRNKALQAEVRKLKSEIENCKLEKNAEITALASEKNFVWNQFKNMESDLTKQLKNKCDEVEYVNQRVQTLKMTNEMLRNDFTKMESESVQKSEEINRLLKEIELLKSRASSSLRPCRTVAATSSQEGKNSAANRSNKTAVKESGPSKIIEKGTYTRQTARKSTGGKAPRRQLTSKGSSSSLKRNEADVTATPDDITPRLFNSSFKIPKLKDSPSPQIH